MGNGVALCCTVCGGFAESLPSTVRSLCLPVQYLQSTCKDSPVSQESLCKRRGTERCPPRPLPHLLRALPHLGMTARSRLHRSTSHHDLVPEQQQHLNGCPGPFTSLLLNTQLQRVLGLFEAHFAVDAINVQANCKLPRQATVLTKWWRKGRRDSRRMCPASMFLHCDER